MNWAEILLAAAQTVWLTQAPEAAPAPQTPSAPRVAVAGVEVSPTLGPVRRRIALAVARGVRLAGATALPVDDTLQGRGDTNAQTPACETPACAADLGQRLGADQLLWARVDSSTESFTVTVFAMDVQDGVVLAEEALTCKAIDPCQPVPQTARDVAREVTRKALAEKALRLREANATAASRAKPTSKSDPLPSQHETTLPSDQPGPSSWWASSAPYWSLAALGSVSTIAGVVALVQEDNTNSCGALSNPDAGPSQCTETGNRDAAGWSLVGGGALLVGGALTSYFLWGPGSQSGDLQITIAPGSIAARGRF